jgi:HEAT repeat protein
MTPEQRVEELRNTFVLPVAEQLPRWRKWAADPNADEGLREEAFGQLALLDDVEGIKLAVAALPKASPRLRGSIARALAHYGKKAAEAIPALQKALPEAGISDKPQLVWALVTLGDPSVFDTAIGMYKELSSVLRLDGGPAFDPVTLARLVPLDDLAKKADDFPTCSSSWSTTRTSRWRARRRAGSAASATRRPAPRCSRRSRPPIRRTAPSSSRRCATASAAWAWCWRSTRW